MPERIIKYIEAIKEATDQLMEQDQSVFVVGLGVSYKNGADGTTAGLKAKYPHRVLDVPVSEASFTGMAVGAAISGLRPIVHHGRVEFALFAADQIFTQAAKWNYMFGGDNPVPAVFRINVGRQWGNGPQHTQSPYSLFGATTGLKVVIPSSPYMAKGLMVSAVKDNNPVVILEPRWLFNIKEDVPSELYSVPLDKAHIVKQGNDITVVSYGDGLHAAREALEYIGQSVSVELIDLVSINPVDYKTVFDSVKKTGRLLCIDTTTAGFNVGSEIISQIVQQQDIVLHDRPHSLACPHVPCPTSTVLTEQYYPTKVDIANMVLSIFMKEKVDTKLSFEELHLAPITTINRAQKKILIIGESARDIFVYCHATRLAPDLPIPVLNILEQKDSPGMAKNVHRNVVGIMDGCDLFTNDNWESVTKTRYMHKSSNHAFIRVDANDRVDRVDVRNIPLDYDVIAISDYNKGYLTEDDIQYICEHHSCVFMDTKKALGSWAEKAKYIKINNYEYERSKQYLTPTLEEKIICTRGEDGAIFRGVHFPVPQKVEVKDTSGAGDSFFAALLVKYVETKDIEQAIHFANECASRVVQQIGVTTI